MLDFLSQPDCLEALMYALILWSDWVGHWKEGQQPDRGSNSAWRRHDQPWKMENDWTWSVAALTYYESWKSPKVQFQLAGFLQDFRKQFAVAVTSTINTFILSSSFRMRPKVHDQILSNFVVWLAFHLSLVDSVLDVIDIPYPVSTQPRPGHLRNNSILQIPILISERRISSGDEEL